MPRQNPEQSAPHSRTVRQCTSVRVQRAETSRHVPPSRTPHVSHASSYTRAPRALSLPVHSNLTLSLPKSWRSFTTISSTIEAPPPRRSITGGRRRSTPTSYTTSTSSSSLELEASQASPSIPFPFLKLQARRTSSSFTKPSTSS